MNSGLLLCLKSFFKLIMNTHITQNVAPVLFHIFAPGFLYCAGALPYRRAELFVLRRRAS